jgi:glycosyltransferase involved in cell wall biosynthesis
LLALSPAGTRLNGVATRPLALDFRETCLDHLANNRYAPRVLRQRLGLDIGTLRTRSGIRLLRRAGIHPDILICATMPAAILTRSHFPRSKIVLWIHGLPPLAARRRNLESLNAVDAVVTPSWAIYQTLWEFHRQEGLRPPFWVIPNFVDVSQFPPVSPQARLQSRAALGLDEDEIAIAHVSRGFLKGLQIVEQALRAANLGSRRVTLFSAGDPEVGRRTVGRGVSIVRIGRLTPVELARLYHACDVGVVPSVGFETLPLTVLEMMACGLCVVASNSGGIPELITDRVNGLLIQRPNDVQAWADAIARLAADPDARRRLASEGSRVVEQRFDGRHFFAEWLRLIQSFEEPELIDARPAEQTAAYAAVAAE